MISAGRHVANDDVARHYDELDDLYRDVWGDHVHHGFWTRHDASSEEAVRALVDQLASRLKLGRGVTILDAGCGYGATARHLVDSLDAVVTAVTLSKRQFDAARKLHAGLDGLRLIHGDVLAVDLPEDSFDVVLAIESLAHIADKDAFFDLCERVLRPGGRVGLCVWLAAEPVSPFARRTLLEPICRDGRLPGMGTLREYCQMIERAGLHIETAEDVTPYVRRTWLVIARRVIHRLATQSRYRRLLVDPGFESRVFALTVFRILAAYYTGAMRYGMIVARKSG